MSDKKSNSSAEDDAIIADLDFFADLDLVENDDKWTDVESASDESLSDGRADETEGAKQ